MNEDEFSKHMRLQRLRTLAEVEKMIDKLYNQEDRISKRQIYNLKQELQKLKEKER